jgi:CheY-like chemotaxis protein
MEAPGMSTFERVVLIDDNDADNLYHDIVIRRAGFKGDILVFECGQDALRFFERDEMSLLTCVFLDINMPMMDGFEVVERAAGVLASKPKALIMMLTSSDSPADRQRAESTPLIRRYFTKPLDVATMQQLMAMKP